MSKIYKNKKNYVKRFSMKTKNNSHNHCSSSSNSRNSSKNQKKLMDSLTKLLPCFQRKKTITYRNIVMVVQTKTNNKFNSK